MFRTARHSALDEDLQTGISGGDYEVAFEIDDIDVVERQGWSVLIQGPAHHVRIRGGARESAEAGGRRALARRGAGAFPAHRPEPHPPCARIKPMRSSTSPGSLAGMASWVISRRRPRVSANSRPIRAQAAQGEGAIAAMW